jgi:hypothetical protein
VTLNSSRNVLLTTFNYAENYAEFGGETSEKLAAANIEKMGRKV